MNVHIIDDYPHVPVSIPNIISPSPFYSHDFEHPHQDICLDLIKISQHYFPTKGSGYEYQVNYNSRPPTWHIDRDVVYYNETGENHLPICSIVLYYDIHPDLVTGELNIDNQMLIRPKNQRIVIFGPGIVHKVEDFDLSRTSIAVLPWIKSPLPRKSSP